MNTAGHTGTNDDVCAHAFPDSERSTPPRRNRLTALIEALRLPRSARGTIGLALGLWAALVAGDAFLAERAAEARASLAAGLVASGIADLTPEAAAPLLPRLARSLDADLTLTVTDRDGARLFAHVVPATPLLAALPPVSAGRAIAGPLGRVEVSVGQQAVLSGVGWRAALGLVVALFVCYRLIRRAAGNERRQRAEALRAMLDLLSDGVVLWDADNRLVAASASLRHNPLVAPALLKRGVGYRQFHDGLRQAGDLTLVANAPNARRLHLSTAAGDAFELHELVSADGVLVTRIVDDRDRARLNGEVMRLNLRLTELAEELQTQRVRGDAASRSKTLFLGQLSHSLRTPLNHIIGFADLLRHQSYGPLGDERYLTYAGNIKQSGETLLGVISNMLELAEFDSGQRVLARDAIRLSDLLDWTLGRYGEQARRAGLVFTVERSREMTIVGDKQCLRRLIGNVVENSLKFTPAGGSLVLAAWAAEDGVVLEITDTGIGIAPDTLGILNSSFALGGESRGNGVAIARAIAELSGGQLEINSTPGIGTTVAVLLPARPVEQGDVGTQPTAQQNVA